MKSHRDLNMLKHLKIKFFLDPMYENTKTKLVEKINNTKNL